MTRIDVSKINYKDFSYQFELFRDPIQLQTWIDVGHNIDNTKIGIYQIKDLSNYDFIFEQFSHLKNIGICFHVLTPGNYLPNHQDKYKFYMKKFNITDVNTIQRSVVFLENSQPGHLLTVNDRVYSSWSAGEIVSWYGETPHSAINLGITPRYTMQITGILK